MCSTNGRPVPKGSVLGPLLFLLYINDIVKDFGSNIRLFAGDTSVHIMADNPVAAAELLNLDLDKITKRAKEWLVKFNPNKTKRLLISRKINHPFHPPLSMLDQQITEVESVTKTPWNLSFKWLHMAQTHRLYQGKGMEQDHCNAKTKVWTRPANH